MPYTTPDEVREALTPEGRGTDATAASFSDQALQSAIDEATAEVDGRIHGAPYPDQAPPLVASITRDIAAYLATLTHRRGNPLPQDHPVRLRYLRAEQLLGEAAKGNIDLPTPPDGPSGEATVVNQWEGDMWTLESLGLGVDSRLLPRQNQ